MILVMTAIAKTKSRITVSILMFVTFSVAAVSSQTQAVSKTQLRLARAVDATLTQGRDAQLPPHISNLLGISPEQLEVPVKQFAIKAEAVRGFDVSVGDHDML